MKKHALLFFSIFSLSSVLFAQDVIKQETCKDSSIQKQADSLKLVYGKDGFEVLRESSMKMESEYEMPVIVPLQERSQYIIVFIGEMSSKLYEVRMYDYDEKMVSYQKKQWGEIDGNIISFSYTPQFSEFHMINPVQVNKKKKKGLCGYVMLFKRARPQGIKNNE